MERDFRKSFDPVWKTTRESKDEAVLHDAYVKAHSLVGDFVVKVKAIPNDNLDPDLLEHSLAKLAFYRNTQANAGAARPHIPENTPVDGILTVTQCTC